MDAMRFNVWSWGEHMSNAFLAFKILNLFEKVEGSKS